MALCFHLNHAFFADSHELSLFGVAKKCLTLIALLLPGLQFWGKNKPSPDLPPCELRSLSAGRSPSAVAIAFKSDRGTLSFIPVAAASLAFVNMTEESPNHMASPSSEEESPRIKIRPFGGKFLPHSHKVSAYITDKFAELQCIQGHSWKSVDEETRDFYWKEFEKNYRWAPRLDADVKKTWNALVADLYKKTLCNWRRKPQPPQRVDAKVWEHWQTVWSSLEWKQKSECGKRNRCGEPAGLGTGLSKHIGGSRSFVEHAIQLSADLKGKGTSWDLFKKTHVKKNGTFVDVRSHSINEKMNVRFNEASQPTTQDGLPQTPTTVAIDNMYLEVVGGVKKKRLYGIGSQAYVTFPHAMSGHAGRAAHTSSCTAIACTDAAATAEAAAVTARYEALTNDNEALRQELDVLQQQFRHLTRNVLVQPLSSPSTPIDDDRILPRSL